MGSSLSKWLVELGVDPDAPPNGQEWRLLVQRLHAIAAKLDTERRDERLNTVISSMGEAVCVVDAKGVTTLVNDAAGRLLGATPAQLVGRSLLGLVASGRSDDVSAHRALATSIAEGHPCRIETTHFATRERIHFPVSLVSTPLFEDRAVSGAVVVFRDISARMATEEALRESESRFRAIFACANVGIVRFWVDGEIAECNDAYAEMLGISASALVGRNVHELIHEQDRAATHARLDESTWRLGVLDSIERRYLRPDGSIVWGLVSTAVIRNDRYLPLFHVNIVENITERKQLELSLRQAQKLESVGRLAAGVAHEINTPIQFIGDNVHFLGDTLEALLRLNEQKSAVVRDGGSDVATTLGRLDESADLEYLAADAPRAVAQTLEGVAHVARIVRALKEFSHPERSEQQSAADLNAALESTILVAKSEIKRVADVSTDLGELPQVVCFVGELNQVWLNLLVNAAHAIEDVVVGTEQRGRIIVRSRLDGDMVEVSITDTGAGIPESIRHRVFDPFFTTKEVGKGTGQGLALARLVVVDKHKGSIAFVDAPDGGTTFVVRIPVAGVTQAHRAA